MKKGTGLGEAMRSAAAERDKQEGKDSNIVSNNASMIALENNTKLVDELVGLNVRVTKRQRLHWLIEAKRQDTSLTAAIIEALNARFGAPSEG